MIVLTSRKLQHLCQCGQGESGGKPYIAVVSKGRAA